MEGTVPACVTDGRSGYSRGLDKGRLTQEDFGLVSNRTYLSALERGLKSPTIDKLQEIAQVIDQY